MNTAGDAFGWAFRDPQWPTCIGVVLSVPYQNAAMAAVTAWFEKQPAAPPAPVPPAA